MCAWLSLKLTWMYCILGHQTLHNEVLKAALTNWPVGQLSCFRHTQRCTYCGQCLSFVRMRIFRSVNSLLQGAESSLKLSCTSSSEDRQNRGDATATGMSLKHRCPSRCCIFILYVFLWCALLCLFLLDIFKAPSLYCLLMEGISLRNKQENWGCA